MGARRERECATCGRVFLGTCVACLACRYRAERVCMDCGRTFQGQYRRCRSCRPAPRSERTCATCGQRFRGTESRCRDCRTTERVCVDCGRPFQGSRNQCPACQTAPYARARRARKRAASVTGSLPASVYAEVLASGPCVYCAAPATSIDHVWPLARGGPELAANLAPACAPCNSSKGSRLLIEWDPVRVAAAVAVSAVVAAEYVRLTLAA